MTGEALFVFLLLLSTIILFVSDRLRLDVVAMLVILALLLSGLLSAKEALAGFGDPVVVLIAGLFVIGEGLFRTGVALAIGNWLMRVGGTSETRMMILLMLVVAGLSAFMSSTGAVAIFIPVTLNLAAKAGINPSRLLLPIAFASLIGGMLTLIGTPPNLVVSNQLTREGLDGFGFFEFTPIGLLVLLAGITYILFWGRKRLPKETADTRKSVKNRLSLQDLMEAYDISDRFHRLRINKESSIASMTVAQALLRTRYGITVLGIERQRRSRTMIIPAVTHTGFEVGDIILVVDTAFELHRLLETERLEHLEAKSGHGRIAAQEVGMAEVLLTPRSTIIGRTLNQIRFRERYGLTVLGILRNGKPLEGNLVQNKLLFGDSVLVGSLGELGPIMLMAGLFLLTSIFSQFISNTATTVLVAPIAMIAATKMGIAPYPLLMTVAIAASTAFSTPVASPVNTLVLGPGGYKFIDFVKLGVPLQLLVMALALLVVPMLFPLN